MRFLLKHTKVLRLLILGITSTLISRDVASVHIMEVPIFYIIVAFYSQEDEVESSDHKGPFLASNAKK